MEFNISKRDVRAVERRHDFLVGPANAQNHVTLARYQVTEEVLRDTRKMLSHKNCIIDRITVKTVTFNDKKAKLLAQGI